MSAQPIPQPEIEEVQHPTLGTLKFPKDMPYDQRNQIIAEMEAQAKPQQQSGGILDFLKGAGKQTAGAMFGGGGMGQGGQLPPASDADMQGGSMNPFSSQYRQGASLSNILPNSVPDLKALNPINPYLNNPNKAEGAGQSLANLLLLGRNLLGKVPYGEVGLPTPGALTRNAAQDAEVVQPLTRLPVQAAATNTAATIPVKTIDQMLKDAKTALNKKYGKTEADWASSQEQAPPPADLVNLLNQSIQLIKAQKGR